MPNTSRLHVRLNVRHIIHVGGAEVGSATANVHTVPCDTFTQNDFNSGS